MRARKDVASILADAISTDTIYRILDIAGQIEHKVRLIILMTRQVGRYG